MLETFTPKRFSADHRAIIDQAASICADYRRQGLTVTLRQVYYQFVARDLLPNTVQSYKRLGGILNDARMAGELDWSYMEDRGRNVRGGFSGYDDPGDYISGVAAGYVEALWAGQTYLPEVWVEKEALVSIIAQGCAPTRVPYPACKGYMSQSEMYVAAKRMQRRRRDGFVPLVIHLGDHDPSGLDMTRDIQDRLTLMSYGDVEVVRVALTMEQIEDQQPPPNPAKQTDARFRRYVEETGLDDSWELDALDPTYLRDLVSSTIEQYLDRDTFDDAVAHETQQRQTIRHVAGYWNNLVEGWPEVAELLGLDDL